MDSHFQIFLKKKLYSWLWETKFVVEMEPRLRKPQPSGISRPIGDASVPVGRGKAHGPEIAFKYDSLLMFSLLAPCGVLIAFGSRPTIICICFGGIAAYIFDLLGTIEVC